MPCQIVGKATLLLLPNNTNWLQTIDPCLALDGLYRAGAGLRMVTIRHDGVGKIVRMSSDSGVHHPSFLTVTAVAKRITIDMGIDIAGFARSLTAASGLRLVLTVILTTGSVMMARQGSASLTLIIGCNIMTIAGALFMEYKNYQARQ